MIKKYDEFIKEEIDLRKVLIGGAIALGIGATTLSIFDIGSCKTEQIMGQDFVKYNYDGNLFVTVSESGIIACVWSEQVSTSDTTTETVFYRTITVPSNTNKVYLKNDIFGSYFYSSDKKISDDSIDINTFNEIENKNGYRVLENEDNLIDHGKYLGVNYIMVTDGVKESEKKFLSRGGEKFSLKSKNYVIIEVDGAYFVVGAGFGGGGSFGGGGTGASY